VGIETTLYVGGLYEKLTRAVSDTPTTEYVHNIRGGNQAVAIVQRYCYDPWGDGVRLSPAHKCARCSRQRCTAFESATKLSVQGEPECPRKII
jgi:hypothetical protein